MFPLLALLFLVVPIVELYVIVQVAGGLGVLQTIGLLILISVVGAWLVKAQGLNIIRKVQGQVRSGSVPGKELVDGALVMFAGALMLTPGFVTDALGLALLLPPSRAVVRTVLIKRFSSQVHVAGFGPAGFGMGAPGQATMDPRARRGYVDVDGTENDAEPVDLSRDDPQDPNQPPSLDR